MHISELYLYLKGVPHDDIHETNSLLLAHTDVPNSQQVSRVFLSHIPSRVALRQRS